MEKKININQVRRIFEQTFKRKISFVDMVAIQQTFDIPQDVSDCIDKFVSQIRDDSFQSFKNK